MEKKKKRVFFHHFVVPWGRLMPVGIFTHGRSPRDCCATTTGQQDFQRLLVTRPRFLPYTRTNGLLSFDLILFAPFSARGSCSVLYHMFLYICMIIILSPNVNPLGPNSRFGDISLETRKTYLCLCSAVLKGLRQRGPFANKCTLFSGTKYLDLEHEMSAVVPEVLPRVICEQN